MGQDTQLPGYSLEAGLEHLSAKILWSLLLLAQELLKALQTLQAKPAPVCLVCKSNLRNWQPLQPLQMRAAELPSWGTLKPDSQEAANATPKGSADFAEGGFSSHCFSRGPCPCSRVSTHSPKGHRTKMVTAWLAISSDTPNSYLSRTMGIPRKPRSPSSQTEAEGRS